ncbi:MAG: hypothetical protein OXG64_07145 [Chloroflexi bacterium]|nr:hypothetical protein [Chloroflexota bacterium]
MHAPHATRADGVVEVMSGQERALGDVLVNRVLAFIGGRRACDGRRDLATSMS